MISYQLLLLYPDLMCGRVRGFQRLPGSVGEPAAATLASMQGRQRGCISTLRLVVIHRNEYFYTQFIFSCMY